MADVQLQLLVRADMPLEPPELVEVDDNLLQIFWAPAFLEVSILVAQALDAVLLGPIRVVDEVSVVLSRALPLAGPLSLVDHHVGGVPARLVLSALKQLTENYLNL
jgi:hypothetical protein